MPLTQLKGILVAFEGIDGAGKTTQVNILADTLRKAGDDVVVSKEPTDGPWGQIIRKSASSHRLPLDEELHAFIEDRREHVHKLILPSLAAGKTVILDRYYYSTIAYQGARGANFRDVWERMKVIAPEPDVVFLMDIDPTTSLRRISEDRKDIPNAFEKTDTLNQAREIFNAISDEDDRVYKLDATRDVQTIAESVLAVFVDFPLRRKRCGKDYGCHDLLHCGPRHAGECDWFNLRERLRAEHRLSNRSAVLSPLTPQDI